eukprot:gene8168-8359_t
MSSYSFSPSIVWDPKVKLYMQHAFGETTFQVVLKQLHHLFPTARPYVHPRVHSAVIVPGTGPWQPDYAACGGREVFINRHAAEAVLKGAQVYSPGLLAASPGLVEGDLVAVAVALEQQAGGWCGINRGMLVTPQLKARLTARLSQMQQQQLYVGVGRVTAGRVGLFRQQQGVAVQMTQRVFDIPPCNGVLSGQVMLQALPCIVAAQALSPEPGSRVLDMCAAPGGKTSMLAQVMGDTGEVVALDRTGAKVAQKLAGYQKALLRSALHVLKPGGCLVYCTCTINPGENEENVRYVLDKFPEMQLVQQPLVLGGPGLVGPEWLTEAEATLVQRFDPAGSLSGAMEDTIGFFIAKFRKTQ